MSVRAHDQGTPAGERIAGHYLSCPDDLHEYLEALTRPFLELEGPFLESAYAYARANWQAVSTA